MREVWFNYKLEKYLGEGLQSKLSRNYVSESFWEFLNSGRSSARISIFHFTILTPIYPRRMKDYRASKRSWESCRKVVT